MSATPRALPYVPILVLLLAGCASRTPVLKEGLWQVTSQTVDNPSQQHLDATYRLCRDHRYDATTTARMKNVPGCITRIDATAAASAKARLVSHSTCRMAGTTIASTGVTVYTSDTVTHSETEATFNPPLNGKSRETLTLDQHYVSKCPVGMKPGDTLDAGGLIQHHAN